jgi:hypothetical protein
MAEFEGPKDLSFNRGLITDPQAFARNADAASWLYLCGEEFATMDGGMSYTDVQEAVDESANIVSDPPRVFDMTLARQHIAALDELPRPTVVTCRTGPRSSAVVYLYAGLRAGPRWTRCWRVLTRTTRPSRTPTNSGRGSCKACANSRPTHNERASRRTRHFAKYCTRQNSLPSGSAISSTTPSS